MARSHEDRILTDRVGGKAKCVNVRWINIRDTPALEWVAEEHDSLDAGGYLGGKLAGSVVDDLGSLTARKVSR